MKKIAWVMLVFSLVGLLLVPLGRFATIGYAVYKLSDSELAGFVAGGALGGGLAYLGGVWGAARLGACIGATAGGFVGALVGGAIGGL